MVPVPCIHPGRALAKGSTWSTRDQRVTTIMKTMGMMAYHALRPVFMSQTETASRVRLASNWLLVPKIGHATM